MMKSLFCSFVMVASLPLAGLCFIAGAACCVIVTAARQGWEVMDTWASPTD